MELISESADWAQLGRYREANALLARDGAPVDVVFVGDSITELWADATPDLFRRGRVNRGIGGQTTPEMVARFEQDVIALCPRVVHIMSGINDVAEILGPISALQIALMLEGVARRALSCGQRVLLGSVLPAAHFLWKPHIADAAARVRELNGFIAALAHKLRVPFIDYAAALDDGAGGMAAGCAHDGVHPTAAGYAIMAPLAERAILAALAELDTRAPASQRASA